MLGAGVGRILLMTGPSSSETVTVTSANSTRSTESVRGIRVLLFSDDRSIRDSVRLAVGRRPARDIEVVEWLEFATAPAVVEAVKAGGVDVLILDGEAAPLGGRGLCRQLKHELFECPSVIVLTARPQDAWLASWSYADHAVPMPVDAMVMAHAVADVVTAASRDDV